MSFLVYLTDFSPKLEACIVLSHETFHILIRMLHEMCIYNVCTDLQYTTVVCFPIPVPIMGYPGVLPDQKWTDCMCKKFVKEENW